MRNNEEGERKSPGSIDADKELDENGDWVHFHEMKRILMHFGVDIEVERPCNVPECPRYLSN